MDTREATKIAKETLQKKYGNDFSPEVFKKAMAKLKRWMKAAYGGLDWDSCSDVADSVDTYYEETLEDTTDGQNTFNMTSFGIHSKRKLK